MATRMDILSCLHHLSVGFPAASPSSETIRAFCEDLEDLDPNVLWQACVQLRKTARFFPVSGEIRAACETIAPMPKEIPAYHQRLLPAPRREDDVPMPDETRRWLARLGERTAMEREATARASGSDRSLSEIRRAIRRTKPEDEAAWQAYSRRVLGKIRPPDSGVGGTGEDAGRSAGSGG